MAKKKKTIQLLPFDYLVKIGRIKKGLYPVQKKVGWIGNQGVCVPEAMEAHMRRVEKLSTNRASPAYSKGIFVLNASWCCQKNWLKP